MQPDTGNRWICLSYQCSWWIDHIHILIIYHVLRHYNNDLYFFSLGNSGYLLAWFDPPWKTGFGNNLIANQNIIRGLLEWLRGERPMTTYPGYYARDALPLWKYAPWDNVPQVKTCPVGSLPQWTICPRWQHAPGDSMPWVIVCPGWQYASKHFAQVTICPGGWHTPLDDISWWMTCPWT